MADKTIHVIGKSGAVDLTEHTDATEIVFTDCHITNLNVSGLSNLLTMNPTQAGKNTLASVDASGCALSEASVDSVLAVLAAGPISSGSLDLSGGTNAVPSAAGLVDKATLDGRGWTVAVNTGSYCAVNVDLSDNLGLTSLDLNGCTIVQTLDVSGCSNLTSLDITGCTALTSLDISGCTSLTSITGIGDCTALITVTGTGSGLTTLNISSHASLTTLTLTNSTALASLNIDYCSSLATLNANGCTSLSSLTANNNMSALGSVYLQNSAFTSLGIAAENLVNLDTSGSSLLTSVSGFYLGNMGATITVNCSGCALDVTTVNDLMANGVNSGEAYNSSSIDVSGGTSASPSGQGITDLETLENRAWTITVNT